MNNKFPKIAFILFFVAAIFLVIDGLLTNSIWYYVLAGIFLLIGLLFAIDMNKKE